MPARTSAQRRFHPQRVRPHPQMRCFHALKCLYITHDAHLLTMDAPLQGDTGGHTGAAPTNLHQTLLPRNLFRFSPSANCSPATFFRFSPSANYSPATFSRFSPSANYSPATFSRFSPSANCSPAYFSCFCPSANYSPAYFSHFCPSANCSPATFFDLVRRQTVRWQPFLI